MDDAEDQKPLSALAQELDCLTDEDLQRLARVKAKTTEAWRKRGTGPAYILFGNRYLYPRAAVSQYLQTLVRERRESPPKGLL